jgi:lipoate-protein ligase A
MIIIHNTETNPFFNIALEEHLFNKLEDDIFMLYRNEPSVIVGKHQNTLKEININYVSKNNIKVVRRISGGGTVYHDLGNVNFTFIQNGENEKLSDFKKYTDPIIQVLRKLGVDAQLNKRNDIIIDDLKVSGNAEHTFKNRVLHHGTILFSADLEKISLALKQNSNKYIDKSVQSVRSKITNIQPYLKNNLEINEFIDLIFDHIKNNNDDAKFYTLTTEDVKAVEELVLNKYSKWEWNFQYVSNYSFYNEIKISNELISAQMTVKNGIIQEIKINSNFNFSILENLLLNQFHQIDLIENVIDIFYKKIKVQNFNKEQLLELFF